MKRSEAFQVLTNLTHQGLTHDQITQQLSGPGSNMYQELEMDSPMVDTHEDSSNGTVDQHTHLFTELLYWAGGEVEYLLGTRRYRIQPGDILLIPPGVVHCPILSGSRDTPCRRYVVWISAAFFELIQSLFPERKPEGKALVLRTRGTRWEYLEQFFLRGLQESNAKAPGWEACLCANTAQLVVHISRVFLENRHHAPQKEEKGLLELVLDYIQHNLNQKITLSSTARHFLVCESTISQLFRREMGTSFYRCVTQRRLMEAKALIGRDVPMEEISAQVGFQEYSCFYRAFKSEYGISPAQYRKMLQE